MLNCWLCFLRKFICKCTNYFKKNNNLLSKNVDAASAKRDLLGCGHVCEASEGIAVWHTVAYKLRYIKRLQEVVVEGRGGLRKHEWSRKTTGGGIKPGYERAGEETVEPL